MVLGDLCKRVIRLSNGRKNHCYIGCKNDKAKIARTEESFVFLWLFFNLYKYKNREGGRERTDTETYRQQGYSKYSLFESYDFRLNRKGWCNLDTVILANKSLDEEPQMTIISNYLPSVSPTVPIGGWLKTTVGMLS